MIPDSSSTSNASFYKDQDPTESELLLTHDDTLSTATTSPGSNSTKYETACMDNAAYSRAFESNLHVTCFCPYIKNKTGLCPYSGDQLYRASDSGWLPSTWALARERVRFNATIIEGRADACR